MTERSRQALIALRQVIGATEFNARNLAKNHDLTNSQLLVLKILNDGEATPGTIAARVGLTQATVTALIDRLVRRGFVHRRRGETDRRRVWVTLTQDGFELLSSMPTDIQDVFRTRFDALADWEQAMMVACLERAAAMLETDDVEAGPVLDMTEMADGDAEEPARIPA